MYFYDFFFFQAEDGIRDLTVTGVQTCALPISDDHFTAGPDCRMPLSASGRVGQAGGRPTVGAGIISAAGVRPAAPDDHFTAGPDGRVEGPGTNGVSGALSPPMADATVGKFWTR